MKLPVTEHTGRPWRIHEIADDFRVEDVWSFRTPGAGPDDFPAMLHALRTVAGWDDPATRVLFAVRWKIGAVLGWDGPGQGLGDRVRSLRERLPADLLDAPLPPDVDAIPFTNLYETADEFAMELANRTVHTVCHLGWVHGDDGDHELRMAALVRPNGVFGRLYMAAIAPFRYLVVYPAMTRRWERAWLTHGLPLRDRPRA